MTEVKYEWDGEKIKQIIEPKKFSTKEIINAIANLDNKIEQMKTQKTQTENQLKQIEKNLIAINKDKKDLTELEPKCLEIQKEKLDLYVRQISADCKKQGEQSAKETIAKDPEAYTDEQKKQLPYLDYQKLLATNEKVVKNISSGIISKYLYEEPIFKNPFK